MRRGRRRNPFTSQTANANPGKFSEKTYYNYSYSNHNGLKAALIAGAVVITIAAVFIITKINSDKERRQVAVGNDSNITETPEIIGSDLMTTPPLSSDNDTAHNTDDSNKSDQQPIDTPTLTDDTSSQSVTGNGLMQSFSPLKEGDISTRVKTMQERLVELGYLHIRETTTLYGAGSVRAVYAFQRQHGLTKTGNADEETLRLMFSEEAQEYMLKEGDKGDDVTQFQDELIELGYMKIHTGLYGSDTVRAIKDFQDYNNLTVTGIADRATIDKVYSHDARRKK